MKRSCRRYRVYLNALGFERIRSSHGADTTTVTCFGRATSVTGTGATRQDALRDAAAKAQAIVDALERTEAPQLELAGVGAS